MSTVKIGPKHQVTIPKDVFEELNLEAGDFLEAVVWEGKIIMIPKELIAKAPMPYLTKEEQEILLRVKEKISRIQIDLSNSQGLTDEEIEIAVKMQLIDPDQVWWWKEEWQKGERDVERELSLDRAKTFSDLDGLIEYLSKKP